MYIYHKIESAILISVLKYENRQQLSNIFDTLVANGVYFSHNRFKSHKEHSIGFFTHDNPKFMFHDNLRMTIQEELICINLNDEESAPIIHHLKDND